jgi:GT2 family glycosyltransferase
MNPHADRFALFQDDLVACKGLRQYLDQCEWPQEKAYLNLLTFRENHELIHDKPVGWHKSDQLGKAAVGLVFDQAGMKSILPSPHMVQWIRNPKDGHRLVDRAVSQSLKKLEFKEYIHNPSLLQHTGVRSSMGSDRHPQSSCFLGEDYDATKLLDPDERSCIESGERRIVTRVAIPAVDAFDLTSSCLSALAESSWPMIVDYVDNGSEPGTLEKVREFGTALGLEMNCTGFPRNMGFTAAVNVSMKLAIENNQHCLILNNDCMVSSDAVRRLHAALMADDSMAAVGPVTMDNGAQSLKRAKNLKESQLKKRPVDPADIEGVSRSLKRFRIRPVRTLAFFCTLLRNTALQKVGVLPEGFADGLGADDAWCVLARNKGYSCCVAHNAYANHMHSETFRRIGINRNLASRKAFRKLRQFEHRNRRQ